MIKSFEDIQKLSQSNTDTAMRMMGEWSKGWQTIATEMTDYSKRSFEEGTATFYSLQNAEDRGLFFIKPGTKVYKGMIIGEHNRPQDLDLNICKAKQLTNHRASGGEELVQLKAPEDMSLERALEYIGPDELLEITPASIRASGEMIGFDRSAAAKIPPEKRPSNMSWCTWMYFSGVPMSIQ